MLIWLFDRLLLLSLAGGGVIALLWPLCRLAGRGLSCRWRYYVWLLPLLLLVLPVALPLPAAAPSPAPAAVQQADPAQGAPPQAPAALPSGQGDAALPVQNGAALAPAGGPAQAQAQIPADRRAAAPLRSLAPLLPVLWLAGAAALCLRRFWQGVRFRRFARRACAPAQPWERERLEALRRSMSLRRPAALLRFPGQGSPFLCGTRRPAVFLPEAPLSPDELDRVLAHELTHLRRWDLPLKGLFWAVRTLHWFNPLAWVMEREAGRYCELSCDEAVAAPLDGPERRAYALTLLKLMRVPSRTVPASAYLAERDIRDRLEVIMRIRSRKKLQRVLALALALAVCAGGAAYAAAVNARTDTGRYTTAEFTELWCAQMALQPNDPAPMQEYLVHLPGTGSTNHITGTATLSSSPWAHRFTADVTAVNLRDTMYGREYIESEPIGFEVEMTSFHRALPEAGIWTGLFTVRRDGEVIYADQPGRLKNVPGPDGDRLTELFVEQSNGNWFRLYMNFGLTGAEQAEADARLAQAERAVEQAPDARSFTLACTGGGTLCGYPINAGQGNSWRPGLTMSKSLGTLKLIMGLPHGELTVNQPAYMHNAGLTLYLDADKVQSFDGDTARGTFYVSDSKRYEDYEFAGTLSGLSGDAGDPVVLHSDDGETHLELMLAPLDDGYDERLARSEGWLGREGTLPREVYQPLAYAADCTWYETAGLDTLPFDLSWDGDGLHLQYSGPGGWHWTALLYNEAGRDWWGYNQDLSAEEYGLTQYAGAYRVRATDAEGAAAELPFSGGGPETYHLYLAAYSTQRGAACKFYELEFFQGDGKVLALSCNESTLDNPDVPADLALEFLRQYMPDYVLSTAPGRG